jgi:hypothetical protein
VVLRYTVLRLLVFLGCLVFFWLVGLRNDQILLLLVSAVASLVISFFLLRRQRDQFSAQIADRIDRRQETRRQAREAGAADADSDEAAEDAEVDGDR